MRQRTPGPGQESVWDYPRPPIVEPCGKQIVIQFNGAVVVETRRSQRVLETSHPPVYYVPREDTAMQVLQPIERRTICEFKGVAHYFDVRVDDRIARAAAWSYPEPVGRYRVIRGHLAFYPSAMDVCLVDGERVQAQAGDFYGGWITSEILGPFKGEPGTWSW